MVQFAKMARFGIGVLMMLVGLFLFLKSVQVNFGFQYPIYYLGRMPITSGTMFIPLMIGVAMVFYDRQNSLGWGVMFVSMALLVFGVVKSTRLSLQTMNGLQLLGILVLLAGGFGMWLNATRK